MGAGTHQAIHSLIDDLQSAADTLNHIHAQTVPANTRPEDAFEDQEAAAERSEELGLDGTHLMEADGTEYHVPGEDHDEYLEALDQNDLELPGEAAGTEQDTDPDAGVDGSASGNSVEASTPFTTELEAASDTEADADGLKGIIWAEGQHDLWVNGEPTSVHVPEDTISETFQMLQQRLNAEGVKIGFDHPDDDSVAAMTALGEIGEAQEFVQATDDGREVIAMKDSEFTNSKAVEAAEAGEFDGFGFSIVGNIALATGEDGEPIQRDDGSLEVAATDIHRVDVVADQAVDDAKIGNLPELASAAAAAGRVAAGSPNQAAEGFVRTLRAAAGTDEANESMKNKDDIPTDPEDLEAAQAALTQASDVVEAKDDQIQNLEAQVSDLEEQADHFEEIAASHGIDPDADDFEAQEVIDAHTEDLRAEIAELEAALPKYDVEAEDQEDRQADLAGSSISELEAKAGKRWREYGQSKAKADELSTAVTADESVGGVEGAGGSQEDADAAAQEVLRARELVEADNAGQSAAEFVQAKYGVDPSEYGTPSELQAQISGGAN